MSGDGPVSGLHRNHVAAVEPDTRADPGPKKRDAVREGMRGCYVKGHWRAHREKTATKGYQRKRASSWVGAPFFSLAAKPVSARPQPQQLPARAGRQSIETELTPGTTRRRPELTHTGHNFGMLHQSLGLVPWTVEQLTHLGLDQVALSVHGLARGQVELSEQPGSGPFLCKRWV